MIIENMSNLFAFFGGLGMFLFGMKIMSDGMQKTAGGKLSKSLGMLTNNRLLAISLGALITAVIQSSGATTVMVVGFVNAGVLNLSQAVGVIMGANIGTTITSWIVSLSQLGSAMQVINPVFYAPLFLGAGSVIMLFSKKQKYRLAGSVFTGLGLLFTGLSFMSSSISPYTDSPVFANAFRIFGNNPFLGMLIGVVVTAIIQSSSASVGILQTLAMNGVVTTNAAIYITLGQNIGSCMTALISSVGSTRTAKRAAVIHLSFNVIGAVIFGFISYVIFTISPALASSHISAVQISVFHTIFNISNTLILYPFADRLVDLSGLIIRETDKEPDEQDDEIAAAFRHLDQRIFESPPFAIDVANLEAVHMGQLTLDNLKRSVDAVLDSDAEKAEEAIQEEDKLKRMEKILTTYLVKVSSLSLNERQHVLVDNLFYSISDIARMGNHAMNIARSAQYLIENDLAFSDTARKDLTELSENASGTVECAIKARLNGNIDMVVKASEFEGKTELLEEKLREKHISRLSKGECEPSVGVEFLDIISNLRRISDHACNVACYVKDEQ